MDISGFAEFLVWFAFSGADATKNGQYADSNAWMAVGFATISALSFGAIVVVDLSAVIITRIGFGSAKGGALGLRHGWGTLLVIVFGAVGAWIVGLLAVMIDMFEIKAQTAVLSGIAWQVVYAKIIERAGTAGSIPDAAKPAADAGLVKVEQSVTTEEEEE